MQNREFEKAVQQKMEELRFVPPDALWDKVEAELPAADKRRRRILFFLLFGSLLAGSFFIKQYFNKPGKETAARLKETMQPVMKTAAENDSTVKMQQQDQEAGEGPQKNNSLQVITGNAAEKQSQKTTKGFAVLRTGAAVAATAKEETAVQYDVNGYRKGRTKAALKIKVKAPLPATAADDKNANGEIAVTDAATVTTASSTVKPAAIVKETLPDTMIVTVKKDTLPVKNEPLHKKNGKRKNWVYGSYLAGGRSSVASSLFSNGPVYYGQSSAITVGVPPSGVNYTAGPSNPLAGAGFAIGFFAEKELSPRFKFSTGLNYMYQFNTIRVGRRVDSSTVANFSSNNSIYAAGYYRAGNTGKYKNSFHFIEAPLLLQYQISPRLPLYAEAGFTVSYLLHSNALVYNSNVAAYVTGITAFNRLSFSPAAGAGFTLLQKKKYPLHIGCQFKYGLSSVVRPGYGNLHLVNSLLYARVPLKK